MTPIHESSVRPLACSQMELAQTNQNTVNMYYVGGTLCIDIEDEGVTVLLDNENLNKRERIAAARLYLDHKTPSHHYYELAQKILEEV